MAVAKRQNVLPLLMDLVVEEPVESDKCGFLLSSESQLTQTEPYIF